MKSCRLLVFVFVFLSATIAVSDEPPPIPATPAAVTELILARPFKLAKGYKYDWGKEKPIVTSGTIVVLKVDRAFLVPRNSAEPVLYAGNQLVQRLNQGQESGHLIGIIPGNLALADTPIWFGRPALPERVDANAIRAERELANEAKIKPIAAANLERVKNEPVEAEDLAALLRDHVAPIVLEFSPQEKSLAETWRLPVARAKGVLK